MQFQSSYMRMFPVELSEGDDLLEGITAFVERKAIWNSYILLSYGALKTAVIRPPHGGTVETHHGDFEIRGLFGTMHSEGMRIRCLLRDLDSGVNLTGELLGGTRVGRPVHIVLGMSHTENAMKQVSA